MTSHNNFIMSSLNSIKSISPFPSLSASASNSSQILSSISWFYPNIFFSSYEEIVPLPSVSNILNTFSSLFLLSIFFLSMEAATNSEQSMVPLLSMSILLNIASISDNLVLSLKALLQPFFSSSRVRNPSPFSSSYQKA